MGGKKLVEPTAGLPAAVAGSGSVRSAAGSHSTQTGASQPTIGGNTM